MPCSQRFHLINVLSVIPPDWVVVDSQKVLECAHIVFLQTTFCEAKRAGSILFSRFGIQVLCSPYLKGKGAKRPVLDWSLICMGIKTRFCVSGGAMVPT